MFALGASTFVEVMVAVMIVTPVVILWITAVVEVIRRGGSGLRIAALLVLILIVPILGPVLYFVFRKDDVTAEDIQMAQADVRRQAARRPVGGPGTYG